MKTRHEAAVAMQSQRRGVVARRTVEAVRVQKEQEASAVAAALVDEICSNVWVDALVTHRAKPAVAAARLASFYGYSYQDVLRVQQADRLMRLRALERKSLLVTWFANNSPFDVQAPARTLIW